MSEAAAELKPSELGPQTIEELLELVASYSPGADLEPIRKAYAYSERAHEGQIRRSGDPYITHPLGVSSILAGWHLDASTIITGLLHDTVEDTSVTLVDVEREFGAVVARLVDGVTKISLMTFRNTHEKQGENIRKMIVAMGKDVRVVLVKLADRLHNMRSLAHMPPDKQLRIARETLDIYAPLASRLGINSLKIELEDLSFRYAYPDAYYSLAGQVARKKREREQYIADVKKILSDELEKRTRVKFEVQGRPKHLWSIFKKMQSRNIDYEQVYDVLAFRVNVHSLSECYEVLGMVHSLWKPIPGRFKDFIAMPKNNNYQSLHTTVMGPQAERIEIQIRTFEMHLIAERGIAAHWSYKEGDDDQVDEAALRKFNGLRELIKEHQQTASGDEFLENIKADLFDSEIYVFTPKGDVKEFPEGATPIDFAYAVHTDVGNHLQAARVNGRMVSLKHALHNGDTVEVITSKTQSPSKDWLKYCVTTRAKSKIRSYVQLEARKRAVIIGREMMEKALRKTGTSVARAFERPEFAKFARDHGCVTEEEILVRVGFGALTPETVLQELHVIATPAPATVPNASEPGLLKKAIQALTVRPQKDQRVDHHGRRDQRRGGALREVLQSHSRRSDPGLHHPGSRDRHPPRRLSQGLRLRPGPPHRRGVGRRRRARSLATGHRARGLSRQRGSTGSNERSVFDPRREHHERAGAHHQGSEGGLHLRGQREKYRAVGQGHGRTQQAQGRDGRHPHHAHLKNSARASAPGEELLSRLPDLFHFLVGIVRVAAAHRDHRDGGQLVALTQDAIVLRDADAFHRARVDFEFGRGEQ